MLIKTKALSICIGAMKFTPVEALHIEALEPPLWFRIELLAGRTDRKMFSRRHQNWYLFVFGDVDQDILFGFQKTKHDKSKLKFGI